MKQVKAWAILFCFLLIFQVSMPQLAKADAISGDTIVTLGEDLTDQQKNQLLQEMGVSNDVQTITVSNAEEHKYLGNYISNAQIGTRAISSSKITTLDKGQGLKVQTNNINWVSKEMYANALATAGVKDADVYITAPFKVSGTAALTGIIKAYEITSDKPIPEAQKQVANEEMVRTAELSDRIGPEKASQLMTNIKEEMAKNPVKNKEDLRSLIKRVADELGITLTDQELDKLVELFNKMKDLNINWDQVKTQLKDVKSNLDNILNSEETKGFFEKVLDFLTNMVDKIKAWFSK